MEVLCNLLSEPSVQFFVRVKHQSISLRPFLARRHQSRMFITLEETWHFGVREKRVHAFQETRVEHIGFVHDKANLLSLATSTSKNRTEIIIKVIAGILVRDFDLENAQPIEPSNETRQRRLARIVSFVVL